MYKDGDRRLNNNYRPISILPIFSKIFEKVACRQLLSYLERNNILKPNQFGFLANKSTSQAFISFLHRTYEALDNGFLYFSLFLDFKKAFDSVSHDILLSKLEFYGVRGVALSWFKSYLSSRIQCVITNGATSSEQYVDCGVPQGSVAGPLLFLIYINDFPNCSNHFQFTLFADDSTLSCSFPRDQIESFHHIINGNLVSICD